VEIPVNKLKHHPINSEIYNLTSIDELMNSIQNVGLLQSLTIDQHNQVVSGNRRYEAVKRLGWKNVEVNRITVKQGNEILLLIHFNKQRVKSITELLAEYDHLKKHYKSQTNKVRNVRQVVSEDIKISDGNLGRILYIRKHNPEMIKLIEDGIMTINQAYLQSQRSFKDEQSFEFTKGSKTDLLNGSDFRFYKKSSNRLTELKDGEVSVIYTSPPYFGKRLYSKDGGLGNEKSPTEFINNLVIHLDDCFRVLNKKGSFFLNLGDTFVRGNLQNIPHKVVIRLQEKGWILRNSIVWCRSNPKPSSSKTNLTPSYEFIFHLVKSSDYHYSPTLTSLSEKTKPSLPPRHRSIKDGSIKSVSPYIPNPLGKNIGDYWSEDIVRTAVSNQKNNNGVEHPAMFPEQIVYLPLLQTSVYPFKPTDNISPIILDPFAGSLSVYKVCKKINDEYGSKLKFVGYDVKQYF
jgi:DNA modification methylase